MPLVVGKRGAAGAGGADAGAAANQGPDLPVVVGAYVWLIVAAFAAWGLWKWADPVDVNPLVDFSLFAPLYILAQAIERLLEPLAAHLPVVRDTGAKHTKNTAETVRDSAVRSLAASPSAEAAAAAAVAQALVNRVRRNLTVVMWALASTLGMLACGAWGIRLLGVMGFKVRPFLDIAVSGLAVGSGTKPLHDVISAVQKAKNAKADPNEVVTTD